MSCSLRAAPASPEPERAARRVRLARSSGSSREATRRRRSRPRSAGAGDSRIGPTKRGSRSRRASPRPPPASRCRHGSRASRPSGSSPAAVPRKRGRSSSASPETPPPDADARRLCALRAAEVSSRLEGVSEAGRRAAAVARRAFRTLRRTSASARCGSRPPGSRATAIAPRRTRVSTRRTGCVLAARLPEPVRIDNALARAAAFLSRAGSPRRRRSTSAGAEPRSPPATRRSLARFLSQEALGLADRRRFGQAAARLEEALAVLRDDPVERARISIDLAATLYHAGRPERCRGLLDDAASLAAGAGRRDLLRTARSNRVELDRRAASGMPRRRRARVFEKAARDGDELWLLVALHHRGRLALGAASSRARREDNARARDLAAKLADRLEIGELWLEEGDRLLYEGDAEGARRAWERAAADPPDRCDTERVAAERLEELSWRARGGPPDAAREASGSPARQRRVRGRGAGRPVAGAARRRRAAARPRGERRASPAAARRRGSRGPRLRASGIRAGAWPFRSGRCGGCARRSPRASPAATAPSGSRPRGSAASTSSTPGASPFCGSAVPPGSGGLARGLDAGAARYRMVLPPARRSRSSTRWRCSSRRFSSAAPPPPAADVSPRAGGAWAS